MTQTAQSLSSSFIKLKIEANGWTTYEMIKFYHLKLLYDFSTLLGHDSSIHNKHQFLGSCTVVSLKKENFALNGTCELWPSVSEWFATWLCARKKNRKPSVFYYCLTEGFTIPRNESRFSTSIIRFPGIAFPISLSDLSRKARLDLLDELDQCAVLFGQVQFRTLLLNYPILNSSRCMWGRGELWIRAHCHSCTACHTMVSHVQELHWGWQQRRYCRSRLPHGRDSQGGET